jgi:hypothetical protein
MARTGKPSLHLTALGLQVHVWEPLPIKGRLLKNIKEEEWSNLYIPSL